MSCIWMLQSVFKCMASEPYICELQLFPLFEYWTAPVYKSRLLCISTRECMLAHAFAWSKTIKNIWKSWKSTFFIMHTRGSRKAHEEKWVLFSWFSNVFDCFWPCASRRSLVEIHNTRLYSKYKLSYVKLWRNTIGCHFHEYLLQKIGKESTPSAEAVKT